MLSENDLFPPPTPRQPFSEVIHGETIVDPYRWLEDGQGKAAHDWTAAQSQYTTALLAERPERPPIVTRLTGLLSAGGVGLPVLRGDRVFYTRRRSGQNQPVLVLRNDGSAGERALLDPNQANDKGTVALDWWHPSPDGTFLAYGYSQNGDEWSTLRILKVATGEHLPDEIHRTRYASVAWEHDHSGFYYTRYPQPGEVPPGEENYHRRVFYHRLGTDPAQDPLVYGAGRPMREMHNVSFSNDGRYLLLTSSHGWNSSDLYYRDESAGPTEFIPIVTGEDALFHGRIVDGTLYALTNLDAPHYRLLAIDLAHPQQENWHEIIPEQSDVILEHFTIAGQHLIVAGLKDAASRLFVYDRRGARQAEVPLPTLGTVAGLAGEAGGDRAFVAFESFALPLHIYRLDLSNRQLEPWAGPHWPQSHRLEPGGNSPDVNSGGAAGDISLAGPAAETSVPGVTDRPARLPEKDAAGAGNYETIAPPLEIANIAVKQVFYPSRDGTMIPMFILHRLDLVPNGATPTVLTGYGGFNISRTPRYTPAIYPWLASGGIYAVANLRGGGEYGEEWHRAGMLGHKQNVFDDFIAAGEYLIREGYTDRAHLGIEGRSNGGLLVGAALTQRPDLFQAVVCGVPLLDMLRYHRFLIGALWISEYGSADDPEQYRWLRAYSPYHNVVEGREYPAVLFYTATSDSRVDPLHARKMTALLQYATGSRRPVLLRVENEAGHGIGKPVSKVVEEQADVWTFLFWRLGLRLAG